MTIDLEQIARACHTANQAVQAATGDPAPSPDWDAAPDGQRESAIAGVAYALAGADPVQLHQEWAEAKIRDGWQWGPTKDATQRTHPALVPYEDLPIEQRVKDIVFHAIVTTLATYLPEPDTDRSYPDPLEDKAHDVAARVSDEQQARYEKAKARYFTASEHPPVVALRDHIIGLATLIDEHVPPGRNQALALTALEDVQMRGNRGIFAPEGLK